MSVLPEAELAYTIHLPSGERLGKNSMPDWKVSCVKVVLGGGAFCAAWRTHCNSKYDSPARRITPTTANAKALFSRRILSEGNAAGTLRPPGDCPESVSRRKRFKSARSSAADWQRTSRSFSKDLLMIRSNSAGNSGFIRAAETGAL